MDINGMYLGHRVCLSARHLLIGDSSPRLALENHEQITLIQRDGDLITCLSLPEFHKNSSYVGFDYRSQYH